MLEKLIDRYFGREEVDHSRRTFLKSFAITAAALSLNPAMAIPTDITIDRSDIAYIWCNNIKQIFRYRDKISPVLEEYNPLITSRLWVVKDHDNTYGLIYDRNSDGEKESAKVARVHSKLLTDAGFAPTLSVKDEHFHLMYNISYGENLSIEDQKENAKTVSNIFREKLGENVGNRLAERLVIEETETGLYTLVLPIRQDYDTTLEEAIKHRSLLNDTYIRTGVRLEDGDTRVWKGEYYQKEMQNLEKKIAQDDNQQKVVDNKSDNSTKQLQDNFDIHDMSNIKETTEKLNQEFGYNLTPTDLAFITRVVYWEGANDPKAKNKNELIKGYQAISSVILNRYEFDKEHESNIFNSDNGLLGVVEKKGQFSCIPAKKSYFTPQSFVRNNNNNNNEVVINTGKMDEEKTKLIYSALIDVLAKKSPDPSQGSIYYKNPDISSTGSWDGTTAFWIDDDSQNSGKYTRNYQTRINSHEFFITRKKNKI